MVERRFRLTVTFPGTRSPRRNPIRDYVAAILEEASAPGGPRSVLLRARLKAMNKAISVVEVAGRQAAERGLTARSVVAMHGMREEGANRRDLPEIEIRLDFEPATTMKACQL
ncbi:unnamed protein product [Polarella glacialis]|uniref:Uncharacterized protein n=1 Tax=Polarella glacialis TaxID=89957 RepID=A0A813GEG3_POLGL|nr:unnamed protein product [Polarella glacialis]